MAATTQKPTLNGNLPHSQTVNHVFSYPLINDLASTYTSTSVGTLSINTYNNLYQALVEPLKPYLKTPYDAVGPYIQQVDSFGDSSLDTIDGHFPALKSTNLDSLKGYAFAVAHFPFKVAGQSKDYVFTTYGDEYKKMQGQDGLIKSGKSVLSTELRMTSEALHAIADYLGPKKDALVAEVDKTKKVGSEKLNDTKKVGSEKVNETKKVGSEKANETKKVGSEKANEAKEKVNSQ